MGTPKEPPRMAENGSPLRTFNSLDTVSPDVRFFGSFRALRGPLRGPQGGHRNRG